MSTYFTFVADVDVFKSPILFANIVKIEELSLKNSSALEFNIL